MYKNTIRWIILIFTFMNAHIVFADHVPWNHPDRKQSFALQQDLRLFIKVDPAVKLLFEFQMKESLSTSGTANHTSGNQKLPEILAFRVGGIFRLHQNFKLGAFYQFHELRNNHTGNLNLENIFMLDFIPRVKLGSSVVAELRVRNEFNHFSGSDQPRLDGNLWYAVKLRPKLTYYIKDSDGLDVVAAPFIAYEIYLPITYDIHNLEHWIYAGLIIPNFFLKELSVIPNYAIRFTGNGGGNHTAGMTHIFGIGLNFNF
ncbi:MAG TPA: hypothetical protein ENI73_04705 [Spirochaetes bacterium]|nr:hypothetical protein [Spirochaetota bacterium]